jgi:hypothetical protein
MGNDWEEKISCATECSKCKKEISQNDQRILSVYSHLPICMDCKKEEEKRPDYEDTSKAMIGQCMMDTELLYGDPGAYCYHHFYPYRC